MSTILGESVFSTGRVPTEVGETGRNITVEVNLPEATMEKAAWAIVKLIVLIGFGLACSNCCCFTASCEGDLKTA